MKTLQDMKYLPAFDAKMIKAGLPPEVVETFRYYYRKVAIGESGLIYDSDIEPVATGAIESSRNLKHFRSLGEKKFKNSVRITLNGGLGTSMGLTGAKSLLKVKDGRSFLEIIAQQTRQQGVKLALMNSFNTHADTLAALKRFDPAAATLTFLQHKFPKILQDDLAPAEWPQNPALEWNPPGHGDVYTALYTSGLMQQALNDGVTYAFISNSDNLGADMDPALLGFFVENNFPFMMEVAEKTTADVKGGHLARQKNGRLILREIAQCPEEELPVCMDIKRYCFFNTNNIWVNLAFLKDLFKREKAIHLPMILNPKTLDPRDGSSPRVFQVETAMGAAISLFEGAAAVKVPRSRFLPVKKCNDLMAVRSDCFEFVQNGASLRINPDRFRKGLPDTVEIHLDPRFYGKIDLFENRFNDGVPSLVDCDSLTIEGDVRFEADVTISGRIHIINRQNTQAVITRGTVIDQDINF
jgi:UTP--glucose-1-phosphate uridylyltransferase